MTYEKSEKLEGSDWLENDGFLLSSDQFAVPPDPFVCPKKGIWPYNPILGMEFRLYSRDGSGFLGCGYLRYIYLEPIVFPLKKDFNNLNKGHLGFRYMRHMGLSVR